MRRAGRLLVAAAVLLTCSAVAPTARADQEQDLQRHDVAPMPADTTTTVVVDRFDPARGELVGVELRLAADLEATIRVENTGAEASTATTTATGGLRLSRAGSAWSVEVEAGEVQADDLDPFDGELDFAGPSGSTRVRDLAAAPVTAVLTTADDLLAFVGTGTLPLTLRATGSAATASTGTSTATSSSVLAGARLDVTYRFLADTRPPDAPVLTARPPLFTADATPTIAFTAEAGASTSCRIDGPAGHGPWAPCSSPWTVDLGPTAAGPFALAVRAIDGAGNTGDPSVAAFTVDLVAPGPSVIVGAPVSPSPVTEPTWTFVSDADTTTTCELDVLGPRPCALSYTADLAGLADGTHRLAIVATDAAGNRGAPVTATYVLDRQAPAAPVFVTSPASPGADPTPSWVVDAEAGSTIACSVDGSPYVACEPSHTVDLTGAPDGLHGLSVRATDLAGNVGPAAAATYLLDRSGPAAPTLTGPPPVGNVDAVTWAFAGETGARFVCQLDLAPPVACDGGAFGATLDLDGVHTFSVHAVDLAGNPGPTATATYLLDRVAPPPPAVTGRPADPSPDDHPAWTFTTGGTMRTAECRIDGGPWSGCSSPATFDLTAAADGPHTFEVRAIDRAGNVGTPSSSTYVLDRTSPAAPTITATPVTPGAGLAPTWAFVGPVDAALECSPAAAGPWSPCSSPRTTTLPGGAPDGPVVLFVRARDAAGNASAAASSTYVLDRTAPAPPTITAAPTSPANRPSATWSFAVEDGSDAECSLDGGPWSGCAGGFVAVFDAGADGAHAFAVRAVDEAGNTSAAATGAYELDTTPPPAPSVGGGPDGPSTDDTPTWELATEPGATLACRVDDGAFLPCAGTAAPDLRAAADGTHSLEVRATDEVGNVGPVTAVAYLLDREAPAAPTFVSLPPSPGRDRTPTWTFTAEAGATTGCSLDGGPEAPCDAELLADLADADDGEHVLVVRARDAAGNTGPDLVGTYVLDTTPPARPVVTGPPPLGRDPVPSWHIAVDADAGVECAVDGAELAPCGAVLQARLADGPHRIAVLAIDAAGNRSEVVTVDHVVDTVAPDTPRVTHQPSATAWSWGVAPPDGAATECSVDGGPWTACGGVVAAAAGNPSPRLEVRAVDAAGNRSPVVAAGAAPAPPPPVAPAPGSVPPVAPTPRPAPVAPTPAPLADAAVAAPLAPLALVATPSAAPVAATEAAATPPRGARLDPERHESAIGNLIPALPPEVAQAIQTAVEHGTLPFVLIGVLIAFLVLQDRVDRRDPKLAQAPLRAEPEYLEFR